MRPIQRLSREGEVAVAKRIEAGREMMLGAIRESPLTPEVILGWRDAFDEGKMLLSDIIDLDATYGSFASAAIWAMAVRCLAISGALSRRHAQPRSGSAPTRSSQSAASSFPK